MIDLFTQGTAAVETLKKAVKLADDLKNVDLRRSLLDLREYLSDSARRTSHFATTIGNYARR